MPTSTSCASSRGLEFEGVLRDFSWSHPDFETSYLAGLDTGIVGPVLGPDGTPVYLGAPMTRTTSGAENFATWFHDSALSSSRAFEFALEPDPASPGTFVFGSDAFFPLDGQLGGNENYTHNYHFTLQAAATFQYRGGESLTFAGEDDAWLFIDRRLVIDLGGLHRSLSSTIQLDALAPSLGLVRGQSYRLDVFFAERHTSDSRFSLRTTLVAEARCAEAG